MKSLSATSSQLSQYLKLPQHLAGTRPRTTMNLLPELDVPPETEADISVQQPMALFPQHAGIGLASQEVEKSQLTIFYGGQILVFDDFPAEKAKYLMLMAGNSKSVDPPAAAPGVGEATALPFARRASPQRSIEKASYQKDGSPAIRPYLPWFLNSSDAPKPD